MHKYQLKYNELIAYSPRDGEQDFSLGHPEPFLTQNPGQIGLSHWVSPRCAGQSLGPKTKTNEALKHASSVALHWAFMARVPC
ncbi:hypothetical protein CDAR_167651 [Caerostris darwini]|uniref:Uncharacterized protein n=1 Tax=Caerostris darwini TaxID=1538125 RepID=A0AAV4M723_9ARAC|nr:hypothetical protein CDAR_167651 [Caerostris darwini]